MNFVTSYSDNNLLNQKNICPIQKLKKVTNLFKTVIYLCTFSTQELGISSIFARKIALVMLHLHFRPKDSASKRYNGVGKR